jgi:hypothetical protein
MIKDEQGKHCKECLAKFNREAVQTSKYNAMFHVMHMLVILHDEFGFGKIRLGRLLERMQNRDAAFKADLEDGVAFTKLRKKLEDIGLIFDEEEIEICTKMERLYEKNITYAEKRRR